jgi:hypothetical protein
MTTKGAVIIGSGPSLKSVDMTQLRGSSAIAFNRAYVAFPSWGFVPRYFACIDRFLLPNIIRDIDELARSHTVECLFIRDTARDLGLALHERVQFVHVTDEPRFSTDLGQLGKFYNVAAFSCQILVALGYSRLLLLGVDGRFLPHPGTEVLDQPHHLLAVSDTDPNHFCPEYLPAGMRFTRPRLDRFMHGWRLLAAQLAGTGVEVKNATPNSAVDCFPNTSLAVGLRWLNCD